MDEKIYVIFVLDIRSTNR